LDRDLCDWVAPITVGRNEVADAMDASVNVNVSFLAAAGHSAATWAAALGEKRSWNRGAGSEFRPWPAASPVRNPLNIR
jgi:hypothetical protein